MYILCPYADLPGIRRAIARGASPNMEGLDEPAPRAGRSVSCTIQTPQTA